MLQVIGHSLKVFKELSPTRKNMYFFLTLLILNKLLSYLNRALWQKVLDQTNQAQLSALIQQWGIKHEKQKSLPFLSRV